MYILLHIQKHYFIYFFWLFLKSSKAFSVAWLIHDALSGLSIDIFKSTLMSSILHRLSIRDITCFANQSTNVFLRKCSAGLLKFKTWSDLFNLVKLFHNECAQEHCLPFPLKHINYRQPILTWSVNSLSFTFQVRHLDIVKKFNWFCFFITVVFQVSTWEKTLKKFVKWKPFTGLTPINQQYGEL